jgi:hypothetical protein
MNNFSAKYLNNIDILNTAIIGFEFEFYTNKDIPYYKLLEKLNNEFKDLNITIQGFRKYHPNTKPTDKNFIITPDNSGGANMVELITGKLSYTMSRIILMKVLKFIKDNGYTTDRSSIHINLSFDTNDDIYKSIEKINKLKLILEIDEDLIYKYFPDRKDSYYAKTVKKIIPYKNFNYSNDAVNILQSNLQLPDDDRYYGVNFTVLNSGRLEFRYLGGANYEEKSNNILELLDYFIILSYNCINESFNDDDFDKLELYLSKNINNYKNFNRLEYFIGKFPTISLEVDRQKTLSLVNVYYGDIYNDIYELIINTFNLENCVINYDTKTIQLELVDANIKGIFKIKDLILIDCTINGGVFENCQFVSCMINNTHLQNCKIIDSDCFNCKVLDSNIDKLSNISDSYLSGGLMDGSMSGGVLRLAKIGEYGDIKDDVKIVDDMNDYFNVYSQPDSENQIKKELPDTGFKKMW